MGKRRVTERKRINKDTTVQLDGMRDPFNERLTEGGSHRIMLNERERELVRKRQLAQQVLALMLEKSLNVSDAVAQLGVKRGEVALMILGDEHNEEMDALRSTTIKRALDMYLDVGSAKPPSLKDIADAVGMNMQQLKRLTESEEFQQAYNALFFQTISDPRLRAVQEGMGELAPYVYSTLKNLLTDKNTPRTVQFGVAKFLAERMNLVKGETRDTNRTELARFLSEHAGTVNIIQNQNITVPDEYREALKTYLPVQESAGDEPAAEGVDLVPG